MNSAGSGYGPAAFSFVRVNALESYKCRKISWWLSNHHDYSSRWKFLSWRQLHTSASLYASLNVFSTSTRLSMLFFAVHLCLWKKNTTLKNSKDKFDLASVNRDSVKLCLPNISWRFGSQEMATESYVNVSTGYAAGYSGLFRHVVTKTCHW
jgi:hypothetical protein